MKKWTAIPAVASLAAVGLFGCSSESSESSSVLSVSDTEIQSDEIQSGKVVPVNVSDAKAHLARYRHSVVNSWELSDSASVDVDSSLQSDNFAVDADVQVEDDSTYTIASAGVDGDGDAWMIQVEGGAVVYSWRH